MVRSCRPFGARAGDVAVEADLERMVAHSRRLIAIEAHAAAWGVMVTQKGLGDDSLAYWQLAVVLGEAPGWVSADEWQPSPTRSWHPSGEGMGLCGHKPEHTGFENDRDARVPFFLWYAVLPRSPPLAKNPASRAERCVEYVPVAGRLGESDC